MARHAPKASANTTKKPTREPRRISFTLTPLGTGLAVCALVLALGWVFFLGLLVGRGYAPEESVPQIARLMPTSPVPSQMQEGAGNGVDDGGDGGESTQSSSAKEVIRPEELRFHQDLQQDATALATESTPEPKAAPSPTPKPTTAPAPKPAPQPTPAPTPLPDAALADAPGYDYSYQVASFADEASAKAMQGRLAELGYASTVQSAEVKGRTWQRVLVHFTATEEGTNAHKEVIASIGIKRFILKRKEPAN